MPATGYAQEGQAVARAGDSGTGIPDGIVYQGRKHQVSWMLIGDGLRYYLSRDMPNGVAIPYQLFVARSAAQASLLTRTDEATVTK